MNSEIDGGSVFLAHLAASGVPNKTTAAPTPGELLKRIEALERYVASVTPAPEEPATYPSRPILYIVGEANAADEYSTREIPVNLPF